MPVGRRPRRSARPRRRRLAAPIVAATLLAACSGAGAAPAAAPAAAAPPTPAGRAAPTLVVLFTVDQLRQDYFTRFERQLTGGLGRLWRGGAVFTEAYQDYAVTETAPGHASTLSGRFPRSTRILNNRLGVPDPNMPLVGSQATGASPLRFEGTTLVDWIAARDRRSRALSVSGKDRGAILPIGRSRQSVFWYDGTTGRFTTSRYYADTLPTWLTRFNARRLPQGVAGRVWMPLLPDTAYAEPDSVPFEAGGKSFTFPYALPADSAAAAQVVAGTPWMDEITLAAALAGVRAMNLGGGRSTDVLAVSLSTTDAIGHRYGPDSREIHDQVVRLDRALGAFLDSLYALRDSTRVVIALTADHGVTGFPELTRARTGQDARWVDLKDAIDRTQQWLDARGAGGTAGIALASGMLFVDKAVLAKARVGPDSVAAFFAAAASGVPGVLRVDRAASLATADTVRDAIARRWLHMLPPQAPIAAVVTLTPGSLWGMPGGSASHGSPHDLDAHVPLILYGPPFATGRYDQFVRVADLAPTLARVVGVPPTERLDGRVLERAVASH